MYSIYNDIYEANKEIDKLYVNKFDLLSNPDIFRKNVLELLVEIGELANETRVFKYWSVKPPASKEIILEEYADCILMILVFMNMLNISLDEEFHNHKDYDAVDQFIYLYKTSSTITENFNKENIKDIFVNFIYLGKLLYFSDEDIIDACFKKINKNKERLEQDY